MLHLSRLQQTNERHRSRGVMATCIIFWVRASPWYISVGSSRMPRIYLWTLKMVLRQGHVITVCILADTDDLWGQGSVLGASHRNFASCVI